MTERTLANILHEIESRFFQHDLSNENVIDSLKTLRDCLKKLDDDSDRLSLIAKQDIIIEFQLFLINLFRQYLIQNKFSFPPSLLSIIFDTICFQSYIDMETNTIVNDRYYNLSLMCLTDQLILKYLEQSELNINDINEYFLNLFCYIGSRSIFNKTAASYSISISRKNIPTFFQLTDVTKRLLRALLIYLNKCFLNNYHFNGNLPACKWVTNMTDVYGFVPYFIQTDYPKVILQWLNHEQNQKDDFCEYWLPVISILYNLARHKSGVDALNQLEGIHILKAWKTRYSFELSQSEDEDLLVAYHMVYALLLEPKELKQEDMLNIQIVLDHILNRTIEAFNSIYLRCGSYNVSEYLTVLSTLAVNDKCLLYTLQRVDIFDLFFEKFLYFNQLFLLNNDLTSIDLNILICSLLYTIFWSISFQSDYHIKLKTNDKFIEIIQQISKIQSNDEYIQMMKRAANGILVNLDLYFIEKQSEILQIINNNNNIKIMISYSHKDNQFCKKLVENVQQRLQVDIWVDFIKLKPPYEDDWEEIAQAITSSDIILMIVTENYCNSKSCRREVIHTDKRNKRMIPIYQGNEYQPEDWFEIRAGSATWVRFGGGKSDEVVMDVLVGLINSQDKTKIQTHQNTPIQPPLPVILPTIHSPIFNVDKPIEQWTSSGVEEWLGLPSSILQLSSGRALHVYMQLLTDENAHRDEYEKQFKHRGVTREQFANMISSFTTLLSLQKIDTTSTIPPEQWMFNEVKYWFEQNNLSKSLFDIFQFTNGAELVTYGKILINSSTRIDAEYDRLRQRIQIQNNREDLLNLDEYARFINALKKIVKRTEEIPTCNIL